jgi:hypothetical protein
MDAKGEQASATMVETQPAAPVTNDTQAVVSHYGKEPLSTHENRLQPKLSDRHQLHKLDSIDVDLFPSCKAR